MNKTLRRLSLCINKKKSQFLCGMTNQRLKASRLNLETGEERSWKIKRMVGGIEVTESESIKPLGNNIDSLLNFGIYWKDIQKKIKVTRI